MSLVLALLTESIKLDQQLFIIFCRSKLYLRKSVVSLDALLTRRIICSWLALNKFSCLFVIERVLFPATAFAKSMNRRTLTSAHRWTAWYDGTALSLVQVRCVQIRSWSLEENDCTINESLPHSKWPRRCADQCYAGDIRYLLVPFSGLRPG